MPELPEVEVLKQSLVKNIKNHRILAVKVNNPNLRYKLSQNFQNKIKKKIIIKIDRLSKYLIFFLNNNTYFIIHLGMSGVIYLKKNKKKIRTSFYFSGNLQDKHNHVLFILSKNKVLVFNDQRRFGFIKYFEKIKINENKIFRNLGPEPLTKKFNYQYVYNIIKKRKVNIKCLLMNQNFVSGLGNIYANEILFFSKLTPFKISKNLKSKEIINIIKWTKILLKKSIKLGGSSIKNYQSIDGKTGRFQQKFSVYGRQNMPCVTKGCKGKIKRTLILNRSTFYCNYCQK